MRAMPFAARPRRRAAAVAVCLLVSALDFMASQEASPAAVNSSSAVRAMRAGCRSVAGAAASVDCSDTAHSADAHCRSFVHVAGLFPLSNAPGLLEACYEGVQCKLAAELAAVDINAAGGLGLLEFGDLVRTGDECDLDGIAGPDNCCPGRVPECKSYCLVLHAYDSRSDSGRAMRIADEHLQLTAAASNGFTLGDLSSEVSGMVQQLLQSHGTPQISYGSTSPTLSDKAMYPTFSRTVPSDALLIGGLVELVQTFGWGIVTILSINREYGQAGATLLMKELTKMSADTEQPIEVAVKDLFFDDDEEDIADKLGMIQQSTSRVIFLHCSTQEAKIVLAAAIARGMVGVGYTWLGSEWAQDSMFDEWNLQPEEREDTQAVLDGIVAIRASRCFGTSRCPTSDRVRQAVQEKEREAGAQSGCHAIDRQTEAAPVVNDFAYFAYDAMLLGAIALNRSLGENGSVSASLSAIRRLGTGSGGGSDMVTATGTFEMSEGDRVMGYDLVNLRDGKWELAGTFKLGESMKLLVDVDPLLAIRWADGTTEIPSDRTEGDVALAAWYLFFTLSFIIVGICVGNLLHAHEFYILPESGAIVILGMIHGGLLKVYSHSEELTEMTRFDTNIFSLFLLPIIIFAAGFSISKADLATSLVPICLTAFIGTSISSTVVGASIYYMGQDGYFAFGSMGGAESLAFGALISAVDPVATLAVFGALGVETDLNMRVFGESMINDGVSIVLFKVFSEYITKEVTPISVVGGFVNFFVLVFGSIFVGVFVALMLALTMKYTWLHATQVEAAMVLMASYLAYGLAESFHQSGIIASLFCGIAMNHWTYHNFTYDGEILARRTVKMFSLLADTVIFFQVGQSTILTVGQEDWSFIGATLVACLLGRALNIIPLCSLYNVWAKPELKISFAEMLVMIHAGLRGAIAFNLALHFPSHHVDVVVNTCMWVILFTIFVLGGTSVMFLQLMGIEIHVDSHDVQHRKVSSAKHKAELSPTAPLIKKLDRKWVLPFVTWRFGSDGTDSQIAHPEQARAHRLNLEWPPPQPGPVGQNGVEEPDGEGEGMEEENNGGGASPSTFEIE